MHRAYPASARFRVIGTPVPVIDALVWFEQRKDFAVSVTGEGRQVPGTNRGMDLFGYPSNAVMGKRHRLSKLPARLRVGDRISRGSLTAPGRGDTGLGRIK